MTEDEEFAAAFQRMAKPRRVHVHETKVRAAIQDILVDVFDLKFDPILEDMPLMMMESTAREAYRTSTERQLESSAIVRERLLQLPVSKSFTAPPNAAISKLIHTSRGLAVKNTDPVRTVWVDGRLVVEVWLNLPVFRKSAAEEARIEPTLISVSWKDPTWH